MEKTFESIQKMPLKDKQLRILEIQEKGFKYEQKEIKEIIKDKWVFVEGRSGTDIVDIDFILLDWAEKEELRIEKEEAKSGNTVINKYFKKYGVLSKKEKPKDNTLHQQYVYFDGKACPGDTWNTELHMYRLNVYKSYENSDSNDASCVQISADMDVEDLMDAKMKGDEPTLRHCHDWHTSPHKKAVNHYKHENWLEDIQTAKDIFMKEVDKLMKGCESFQYNEKTGVYCVPEKFVFWFEIEADHNGDDTKFYRSNIYGTNKYKSSGYSRNTMTVPKKFDKTVSKGEIMELAMKHCEDKFEEHNFRKEFRY